jgi:hypothetical protein
MEGSSLASSRVQVYLHKYEWFLPVDSNTF